MADTLPLSSLLQQQDVRTYVQRIGKCLNDRQRRISPTAFKFADIAIRKARGISERLNCKVARLPNTPDVSPKCLPQIHRSNGSETTSPLQSL